MKDITVDTYNKIVRKWTKRYWTSSHEKAYKEFFKVFKGRTILDVGCGPGKDVKYFTAKGYKVLGIDASEGMLKEARARVPEGSFKKANMEKLKFEENRFDAIWCIASLLHVPKDRADAVIKKFAYILCKNGILFLAVKEGRGIEMKVSNDGTKRFFAYYAEGEIKKKVSKYLKVIKIYKHMDEHSNMWINVIARKKLI